MNGTKPPVQSAKSLVNGQRPRTPNQERDFSCCRIVLLGTSGVGKTGRYVLCKLKPKLNIPELDNIKREGIIHRKLCTSGVHLGFTIINDCNLL